MSEEIIIPSWANCGFYCLKLLDSETDKNYKLNGFQSNTILRVQDIIDIKRHYKEEGVVILDLMGPYMGMGEFLCETKKDEFECLLQMTKMAANICVMLQEDRLCH